MTDTPAPYTDRSKPPKLYATPDSITGKRRDCVVILTEDLDEATLALLLNAEPCASSKALDYQMDETYPNEAAWKEPTNSQTKQTVTVIDL